MLVRRSVSSVACVALALSVAGCHADTSDAASGSTAGSSGSAGNSGSAGSSTGSTSSGAPACVSRILTDPNVAERAACPFKTGAAATDTLGVSAADRAAIPVRHLVIVMNENRSFDHYFGRLPQAGKTDVDVWPAGFANLDAKGVSVPPYHLTTPCLEADPPHQWDDIHADWDNGKMDGFVVRATTATSDGHFVMGYYEEADLPFYYWLAKTFAFADHHFSSVISGTWPNREYLYAGTSNGGHSTGDVTMKGVPTIFEAMTAAKITWGVYTDGTPRQDCLGWTLESPGVAGYAAFVQALADGSLPQVSFVDPSGGDEDEHPANSIHGGEAWTRDIVTNAFKSPLWDELAVVVTYDEAGGIADHVPPPPACIPSASQTEFNRDGVRVPLFVVSPWARPGYVSHATHEHASILRLLELLFELPALTARDANSDALLDLFDFGCPALLTPPEAPAAATGPACP